MPLPLGGLPWANPAMVLMYQSTILALVVLSLAVAVHGTSCDVCGASASYSETIDTSGTYAKRTMVSNGCPNHYNLCTGKDCTDGCGATGEEGTATEAIEIAYYFGRCDGMRAIG